LVDDPYVQGTVCKLIACLSVSKGCKGTLLKHDQSIDKTETFYIIMSFIEKGFSFDV
jgi:hypothetical protein